MTHYSPVRPPWRWLAAVPEPRIRTLANRAPSSQGLPIETMDMHSVAATRCIGDLNLSAERTLPLTAAPTLYSDCSVCNLTPILLRQVPLEGAGGGSGDGGAADVIVQVFVNNLVHE